MNCVPIPDCTDEQYRPLDGTNNDEGYVDCIAIPACAEGTYRPTAGTANTDTGLIDCADCMPGCTSCNDGETCLPN